MKISLLAALALAAPAAAQTTPAPAAAQSPPAPKLIVAIAVDQYSTDLFNEYRALMTGGIKRLMQGAVFPSGYQSHAATETCPGHSTILTGSRPARNGIVANDWSNPASTRTGKDGAIDYAVYCSEDESIPGTSSSNYVVSPRHLKVPTLGDRLKAVSPQTRVVSVSGKDRGAVMLAGHKGDQVWWWGGTGFVTWKDWAGTPPAAVAKANAQAKAVIDRPAPVKLPPACASRNMVLPIDNGSVGTLQPKEAGDARGFRSGPDFDRATLTLAEGALAEYKLGQGAAVDVLAVSLSATDYVGHTYGTEGGEMCNQIIALDAMLGGFFAKLDATKIPYAVVLTADHGGHDLPERNNVNGLGDAKRVATQPNIASISAALAAKHGLTQPVLIGGSFGDVYLGAGVPTAKRTHVLKDARAAILTHPDVYAVFDRAEITSAPAPGGPPENWSIPTRIKASFDPERSGDLYVVLKERVTPIPVSGLGYVATHGSVWNYDRRVPILFWQKGITGFEQPNGVETVDILPTLASLIGLAIPAGAIDGRCLDIRAGSESNCR